MGEVDSFKLGKGSVLFDTSKKALSMPKLRTTKDQIERKLITGDYLRPLRGNPNRQAWSAAGVVMQSINALGKSIV